MSVPPVAPGRDGARFDRASLPAIDKPNIAAVEGSEAIVEAFRRLTATTIGALQLKLPPSPEELRDLQRQAVQQAAKPEEARALIGEILARFHETHLTGLRREFEVFQHAVFDFLGDYYVAVPINAQRTEARYLANLFVGLEGKGIVDRVLLPHRLRGQAEAQAAGKLIRRGAGVPALPLPRRRLVEARARRDPGRWSAPSRREAAGRNDARARASCQVERSRRERKTRDSGEVLGRSAGGG